MNDYTLTLYISRNGNHALKMIVVNDKPAWLFVTNDDWKRTSISVTLPTDGTSTEPKLEFDPETALHFDDGAERILEAIKFTRMIAPLVASMGVDCSKVIC